MNEADNIIALRVKKSVKAWQDAIFLLDDDRYDSCISRLYYAVYHIVSALLLKYGVEPNSHKGLIIKFHQHIILKEKLDSKYGKMITHLFQHRQESDYADEAEFTKEEVLILMEERKMLIAAVNALL